MQNLRDRGRLWNPRAISHKKKKYTNYNFNENVQ